MSDAVAEKLAKKSSKYSKKKQLRLKLVRIDLFSTLKLSFLLGVCLAIMGIVGAFLVWIILDFTGVFSQISNIFADASEDAGKVVASFLSLAQLMGVAIVMGIVNIVFVTILGTFFAFLYNVSVKLTGGLSVGFTNN